MRSIYDYVPVPVGHWPMDDNAANAAVVDAIGNHNGTAQQNTSVIHVANSKNAPTGMVILKTNTALVTFVFDDGNDSDYDVMKPIFDAQGEVACSAIVTDIVGDEGRLTWVEIAELQAAGWEILNHTKTHTNLTTLNEAQINAEFTVSQAAFAANSIITNNAVYPGNAHNALVRKVTQEYFRGARAATVGSIRKTLHAHALGGSNADDHTKLTTYQASVDYVESGGLWLIFYIHNTDSDDATTISSLIDYIQAKGISIVTIQQGLDAAELITGKINGALDNGPSDYIEMADHADFTPAGTPFSISAWVYMRDATDFQIASKGVYNTDGEWHFCTGGGDKLIGWLFDESVADCRIGRYYTTALTSYQNQWIQVTLTYSGGAENSAIKLYLNGIRVDNADNGINDGSFLEVEDGLAHAVWIGKYDATKADGLFNNVRIFTIELTARQVRKLFDIRGKESVYGPRPNRIYHTNRNNGIFGGVKEGCTV